jgi:hypothetical protein
MNQYLVDLDLPEELSDEFLSLIPHQREHVDQMMADGVLSSYALSSDRRKTIHLSAVKCRHLLINETAKHITLCVRKKI